MTSWPETARKMLLQSLCSVANDIAAVLQFALLKNEEKNVYLMHYVGI